MLTEKFIFHLYELYVLCMVLFSSLNIIYEFLFFIFLESCGVNEERLECGSACPPTCDNKNPQFCTKQCVNGCFCKKGFIREKKGGGCIPETQCPPGNFFFFLLSLPHV